MKKLLIVALALLAVTTVAACKSNSGESRTSDQNVYSPPMTTSASLADKGSGAVPTTTASTTPSELGPETTSTAVPDQRMIVRTGNISMVVNDISTALADIAQLAEGYQGYVVSSNTWKNGEQMFGSISIRVPAESYDTASKSISQMAVDVTSQSTSSQDVTEQYVDLTAQLSNLQATEQQLLLIMAKADKIEDILAVQTQLTAVQSQIEQIQGTMQYLEKTSATSLIDVSLSQAALEAKFSASSVNAKTGDGIQFYPDIAGGFTPYSYQWDFGDGKTSTDVSPTHSYSKPGEFTISLKVTDDRANTVTETRENYVKITQGGWSVGGVASGAWGAMVWLGRALVTVIIGVGIFSPLIIVIGGIIWWLRRRRAKAA